MMNNYFDTTLGIKHEELIQRAITPLVMLQSQQSQLDQNIP
jgi:hypothetical protein